MRKLLTVSLAALALMALMVGGVSAQDSDSSGRTITVNGSGSTSGDPDMATITLGVEQRNESIADAYSEVNQTLDTIIQQLTDLGISEDDIQTADLNIFTDERPPRPDENSMVGETQRSFRVMNRVNVVVRDLSLLEDVIDTAVNAGANNIFGLNFSINDPSDLEAQARVQALEEARARAQQIADAIGVELGAVQTVVEEGDSFVRPAAEAAMGGRGGGGGAAIERGQLSVTVNVRVTFAIAGDS
jgi:hypothetical protein